MKFIISSLSLISWIIKDHSINGTPRANPLLIKSILITSKQVPDQRGCRYRKEEGRRNKLEHSWLKTVSFFPESSNAYQATVLASRRTCTLRMRATKEDTAPSG